jgi:hypothetical protein
MNQSINFLKNKEGKYLNFKDVKEPYYTVSFINATPIPNMKDAIKLSDHFKCDIYSVELETFKKEYSTIVSKIVLIGELLHRELKVYNDSIPVLPKLNKHVRTSVQGTISKLKQFHTLSDSIINSGNDELFLDTSANVDLLMTKLSKTLNEKTIEEVIKKIN